ncbi:MAG: response regulator [Thermodesulfovibrionales bacterium]
MIFVVDDDDAVSGTAKEILSAEGYEVLTFNNAQRALESSEGGEPELVISDVMMPEMGGFEFKAEYSMRFPHRQTPFVFLSSLSDTENIIRGLDLGADDYLVKPVDPDLLRAKIRSILSRKKRYSVPVFHGDLGKLPFVKLLQFCELKGITGEIEISGGETLARVQLRGGNLVLETIDDEVLEQLYDRADGRFVIYAHPVDFKDIEDAAVSPEKKPSVRMADKDKPMGRLSGVRAQEKLFQLQTEFITFPENQVVTIVILDGKVLMKRKTPVSPDMTERRAIEKMMDELHSSVEKEVNEKVADLMKKKTATRDTPKERFSLLFEEGFDRYREHNYTEALALWEEAYALNPTDKIVETNIRMLRKKLKLDS